MTMTPKIICRKCGHDLDPADKFCGSCGTAVVWPTRPEPADPAPKQGKDAPSGSLRCPLCGQENNRDAYTCESCGNALRTPPVQSSRPGKRQSPSKSSHASPLTFFQSWKFVSSVAAVLIVAVILYKNFQPTGSDAPAQGMSPNAAAALEQIESLQKIVEANPQDAAQTLRLANMLHDVRFFPRAATMYTRYLQLNPSNADARVDLGTTYFELSMTDTVRRQEYLDAAKSEMTKALGFAPRHQLAHFNLGIISLHDGNMAESNAWFAKCIAIDSTSDAARRAEQLLHQHSTTNTQ